MKHPAQPFFDLINEQLDRTEKTLGKFKAANEGEPVREGYEFFETLYVKKTKARKRCRYCYRLLKDGDHAEFRKYTPEAALKIFYRRSETQWRPYHFDCSQQLDADRARLASERAARRKS